MTALVLVVLGGSMMTLIGDFTQEVFAQVARTGQAEQVSP